ncbi:MAG: hypothetical protein CL908_22580 [Deltaproteobacteria bacterium]|jgi:hypothetical protein|nr:hypothetical protein [Deltaproteobacteria bacterium]
MEKLVYLLRRPGDHSPEDFHNELLQGTATHLLENGARGLSINVADIAALPEGIHMSDPHARLGACVSIWLDSLDARGPMEAQLAALSANPAGYLVTESLARDYARRDWPDGARSPGVTLVAAFPKARDIDAATFFSEWQERHTPLSLSMHPLTRYVRNSVARVLTPDAPPYWGLVEERVANLQDLTDPERFFGSLENQERASEHLQRFTDLDAMHTALMSEYIFRSLPG